MEFGLTDEQVAKLDAWLAQQKIKVLAERITIVEKQLEEARAKGVASEIIAAERSLGRLKRGELYGGAIGGALTYSFTPTSLGTVTKVYFAHSKEEIDLTDYDSW